MSTLNLIVFSHLRWNFVFQRPQHLHSGFARKRRVYFVEEPVLGEAGEPHWEREEHAGGNLVVLRPHTPVAQCGFAGEQMPVLQRLLAELVEKEGLQSCIAWFYTPLALPLLASLRPELVVYDCMDDLASFRNAPAELPQREAELLARADLVFTGGPSLYEARKDKHPSVYCFPSSVDAKHYAQARPEQVTEGFEAEDQRALPRPRFGYFGVIDERIDLQLLEHLSRSRPEWQIVMVGPVVKIDPATLPAAPNLHYTGQRPYADLPRYLAGWDVCLLPFALNEATRWISPTKTLEYMAAERPIVSTPVRDVAGPHGDTVRLGMDPESFVQVCEEALREAPGEWHARRERMRATLARTSWAATVAAMEDLMDSALRRKHAKGGHAQFSSKANGAREKTPPVVVIGAGPTGLSTAYHLGEDALLVERAPIVGGLCRSFKQNGFIFDAAGHIMFSNDPYVHQMYELLLGDNVHWQDREAWIYSKNVYTRYPFQGSLYGLPPEVIKDCLLGAIEARFGKPDEKPEPDGAAAALHDGSRSNGRCRNGGDGRGLGQRGSAVALSVDDCCGDGLLESTAPLLMRAASKSNGGSCRNGGAQNSENFEDFIYRVWGAGIGRHFAIPYNRKLWAVDLREMETSWLGGRVPMPDLEQMIDGALKPSPKPMGPNARFGYPLEGGFQALMEGFLPHLAGPLWLERSVVAVSPSRHTVTFDDGRTVPYERLVSTMPLPKLIACMGAEAPADISEAAHSLRHVSVRCVHLGIGREKLTEKHWIYYPEDPVFHRIFVQGNASPGCNPPGGFGLTCEITYSPDKPLPAEGDKLTELALRDCRRVGIVGENDPVWAAFQVDIPYAYVVYDHGRSKRVARVREWLAQRDILLSGRYSEWEYYNSDHAFLAGRGAAEQCRQAEPVLAATKSVL